MQCSMKAVDWLTRLFLTLVKLCLLKYGVSAGKEVSIQPPFNGLIIVRILGSQVQGYRYVLCFLTHGVDKGIHLVFVRLCLQSEHNAKSFKMLYPFCPVISLNGEVLQRDDLKLTHVIMSPFTQLLLDWQLTFAKMAKNKNTVSDAQLTFLLTGGITHRHMRPHITPVLPQWVSLFFISPLPTATQAQTFLPLLIYLILHFKHSQQN